MAFYKDTRNIYRVSELDRLAWLEHGFGTRASGAWVAGNLVTLRQVHSDTCVWVDRAGGPVIKGDALVSNTPGLFLGVRTADCLPIFIVDERLRAIAAVHAGWRGAAARISAKAVETLAARFSSHPQDLLAAIGPGICAACYRVGPEVAQRFRAWLPELSGLAGETGLDLLEANRRQLVEAGIPPGRIFAGAPCTFCHPDQFHSHRRDSQKAGRMLSAIGVKDEFSLAG
jgi:YfiH family protein